MTGGSKDLILPSIVHTLSKKEEVDKLVIGTAVTGKTAELPKSVFKKALKRKVNVTVIGKSGNGYCVSDKLFEHNLFNNNYRKRNHMPLVRKGHPAYEIVKLYKTPPKVYSLKKQVKGRKIHE